MSIDFSLSPELEEIRARVRTFIDDVVRPEEERIKGEQLEKVDRSGYLRALIDMRKQAQDEGLWLPQMPTEWGGMGLGHVQLAMVQAEAAKSYYGPWVLNCQAPDEGNMHTLLHWATDEQKTKYLKPLCDGMAWSCFAMTEPEVAGSDPDADPDQRLPGRRGVGHQRPQVVHLERPSRANFAILIARTEDDPEIPQAANTAFIIDIPSEGWEEVREIETMHGSTGHSEIRITDLRVSESPDAGRARPGPPARSVPAGPGPPGALHALDRPGGDGAGHDGRPLAQPVRPRVAPGREAGHPVDDRRLGDGAVPGQAHGAARRVQDRPRRRLQGRGVHGQALRGQHAWVG